MKIERTELIRKLKEYVIKDSGVIIGPPGVGKTYTISELIKDLSDYNVLFLPIEQLGDGSEEDLRSILEYEGNFVEWIKKGVSGLDKKCIIIFDAYDSARDEVKRSNFLRIISQIKRELSDYINVIVTVRTFDAKKSAELINLFQTNKNENNIVGEIDCRYFLIPPLQDEEIEQAKIQIPFLDEILLNSTKELNDILRIPFNLWLLEKILSSFQNITEFTPIRSEVQLLNLFWKKRVTDHKNSMLREFVLNKVATRMVETKSLTSRISEVIEPAIVPTFEELLSDEILKRVLLNGQRISFSHNILFDYAVNILLIDEDKHGLERFLEEDFSRPLFLRPSLTYFFTRLWYYNQSKFWEIYSYLLSNNAVQINLFARIIPTNVLIKEIGHLEEIQPLLMDLSSGRDRAFEGAKRILQSLRMLKNINVELWSNILNKITEFIDEKIIWELGFIANSLLDGALAGNNKSAINNLGLIARKLMEWILNNRGKTKKWYDTVGSRFALSMILKTFPTNLPESRALILNVLSLKKEKDFPIDYYFMLTNDIESIWRTDPELGRIIYTDIFSYKEEDSSPTNIGGPVLALLSNRKQDYELCFYNLEQKFSKFLEEQPIEAAITAIIVINNYAADKHPFYFSLESPKTESKTFNFRGYECRFSYGSMWFYDSSYEEISAPVKMINILFSYIGKISDTSETMLDEYLDLLVKYSSANIIWIKLIDTAIANPKVFFPKLFPLLISKEFIFGVGAYEKISIFLKESKEFLTETQIASIENTIIEFTDDSLDSNLLDYQKRFILLALPFEKLRDTRILKLIGNGDSHNEPKKNKEQNTSYNLNNLDEFIDTSSPYSAQDNLANEKAHEYYVKLRELIDSTKNTETDKQAISRIPVVLCEAFDYVKNNSNDDLYSKLWTNIAEATRAILDYFDLFDSIDQQKLKEIIIAFTDENITGYIEKKDDSFTFPAWSVSPINEASGILPWLYVKTGDKTLIPYINKLAEYNTPSVRYLVYRELWRISKLALEEYKRIIDSGLENETNNLVKGSILYSLNYALNIDYGWVAPRILNILSQSFSLDTNNEFFNLSCSVLIRLIIQFNEPQALKIVEEWGQNPLRNAKSLKRIANETLKSVELEYLKTNNEYLFNNAIDLLMRLLSISVNGLNILLEKSQTDTTQIEKELFRNIYGIIDETVSRIYFNAKIPDKEFKLKNETVDENIREYYYKKTLVLLNKLLQTVDEGKNTFLLAHSAHYFMQYLNGVIKYDPEYVVNMAYKVVNSSKSSNYNLDPLAIREVVKLVDTLLANYRDKFQNSNSLKDLVKLLDIFADTGWPEALELVWRLDEIYR